MRISSAYRARARRRNTHWRFRLRGNMRQIRGFDRAIATRGDLTICQKRLHLLAGCADYPIATNDLWLLAPARQHRLSAKVGSDSSGKLGRRGRRFRANFDTKSVRGSADAHLAWMSG